MTGTLVWQVKPKNNNKLPLQLKCILEKKINFPHLVGFSDKDYLAGLKDAGVEGAHDLIKLIDEFELIELNIEY